MFTIFHDVLTLKKNNTHSLFAPIMMFVLITGCQTVSEKHAVTEPTHVTSAICDSDTDSFCVEGDQDRAVRLNRQGIEYTVKRDYDKALDFFNQAIALDNSNPEFHYNLGVTYSYKGMEEEEEAAYLNVLAIEPDDPLANPALANTYFNLACLYALQGKKDQAFLKLEKLLTVDPRTLYHYLQSDEDLKSLRDDERFKQLVAKQYGDTFKFREDDRSFGALKPIPPEDPAR